MKIAMLLASTVMASSLAQASHGVEKMLPADAKNAKIESVSLDQVATTIKSERCDNDGCITEFYYETRLGVTVTYESKDDTDVSKAADDTDTTPRLFFEFTISPAQIDDIQNKRVSAASLVAKPQIVVQQYLIDDPSTQAVCRYDNDSNMVIGDCQEPAAPKITISRPTLILDLN